jgi:hypothetical protein
MGLSQPKKNIARSALNLLSKGFWGDFSNPNFYNIVGIKCCPHLPYSGTFFRDPERKWGRILRQIPFLRGTTGAGGA